MNTKKEIVYNEQKEILFHIEAKTGLDRDIIMGVIHKPIADEKKSVVIICGGLNTDRSDVNRISVKTARRLASNNFPVVRFDYRGLALSSGNTWDMTISSKIADIEHIMNYLKDEWMYNDFILIGFSDGAKNVIEISSKFPDVKKIVLWNPTLIQGSNKENKKQKPIYKKEIDSLLWELKGIYLGSGFYRDLINYEKKVEQQLHCLKTPTLVVWGENDVTVKNTRDKISYSNNKCINEYEIPNATHLFSRTDWFHELCQITKHWISN